MALSISTKRRVRRNWRVAWIGDSTLEQGGNGEAAVRAKLTALGWASGNIWFYAYGGKALTSADGNGYTFADNTAQARAFFGGEPETWVINLGGNVAGASDSTITSQMTSCMNNLGAAPERVFWIGLSQVAGSSVEPGRLQFNTLAKPIVEAKSNATWCDWNAYLRAIPDDASYWTDDRHHTTLGYNVKNTYTTTLVGPAI